MRWLVEVTSIGKNDKETFCVDADTWQRALQVTRTLRKETAPMSGFSIELLDEGCRAVDPMSRLRYEVKRTRDDTPLSSGAQAAAAATPGSMPPPAKPAGGSSRPAPPAPVKRPSVGKTTAIMGSAAGQVQHVAEASKVVAPAAPTPMAPVAAAPVAAAPVVAAPVAAQVAVVPVAAAPVAAVASSQIIFKREQDPTDAVPIAYREYVFVVAQGTSEASAEAVLRAQLEQVRASIAALPSGKLVQLAAFDVMFKGRPPVRPLATLAWKDWRGEAELAFPRRPGYVAPKYTPTPPAAAAAPPPAAFAVPHAAPAPAVAPTPPPPAAAPPPAPAFAPPPAPAFAPPPAPAFAPPPAPALAPPLAFAPPPVAAPAAPVPAPVQQIAGPNDTQPLAAMTDAAAIAAPVAAAPVKAPSRPPAPDFALTMPERRPSSASMRAARPRARVRGDELIADLFDAMHDLHFLRDAVDGAAFCLTLALEKLPAQFGVVHLYDIDRREFVVASTHGQGAHVLLLARYPESEPLLLAAMRKRRAVVVADAAHAGDAPLARFAALGKIASLVVAPVMQSGRFLGAIELINPLDDAPFTEDEAHALTYIAEQFGEFVANVGVVTDPERITAAASQPARR